MDAMRTKWKQSHNALKSRDTQRSRRGLSCIRIASGDSFPDETGLYLGSRARPRPEAANNSGMIRVPTPPDARPWNTNPRRSILRASN